MSWSIPFFKFIFILFYFNAKFAKFLAGYNFSLSLNQIQTNLKAFNEWQGFIQIWSIVLDTSINRKPCLQKVVIHNR
jgi:hypothetical protein